MIIAEALVFARWAHFTAATILFGAPLFRFCALRDGRAVWHAPDAATLRYVSLAAAISGLAWLAFSIITVTGEPGSLFDAELLSAFFLQTGFGLVWLIRLAILAAVVALAWRSGPGPVRSALVAAFASLLLVSQAWLGHAAAVEGWLGPVAIAAYAVHVLGAGAWIGGLVPLGSELARLGRGQGGDEVEEARGVLRRFSSMGMVAVLAILASGVINTALRIASWADFLDTDYGRILLAKLGLFAIMLAIAGINRFALMPLAAARSGTLEKIRRNVGLELILGALVLGLAAMLGSQMPPD